MGSTGPLQVCQPVQRKLRAADIYRTSTASRRQDARRAREKGDPALSQHRPAECWIEIKRNIGLPNVGSKLKLTTARWMLERCQSGQALIKTRRPQLTLSGHFSGSQFSRYYAFRGSLCGQRARDDDRQNDKGAPGQKYDCPKAQYLPHAIFVSPTVSNFSLTDPPDPACGGKARECRQCPDNRRPPDQDTKPWHQCRCDQRNHEYRNRAH